MTNDQENKRTLCMDYITNKQVPHDDLKCMSFLIITQNHLEAVWLLFKAWVNRGGLEGTAVTYGSGGRGGGGYVIHVWQAYLWQLTADTG